MKPIAQEQLAKAAFLVVAFLGMPLGAILFVIALFSNDDTGLSRISSVLFIASASLVLLLLVLLTSLRRRSLEHAHQRAMAAGHAYLRVEPATRVHPGGKATSGWLTQEDTGAIAFWSIYEGDDVTLACEAIEARASIPSPRGSARGAFSLQLRSIHSAEVFEVEAPASWVEGSPSASLPPARIVQRGKLRPAAG